ncbi:hypothetical protein ACFPOE_12810 [Caenimonas terrae]|uniref:Glycosyltransferase n=1 Tax=Caenimonas terrae TaxID=696074 RepID=A0ABW0NFQ6_9BURK
MAELKKKILTSALENALGMAALYGNLAWHNFVGIYSAEEIEDALFEKINSRELQVARSEKNGRLIHVLSEGYLSGGHTRVVERLVAAGAGVLGQDVVVTGLLPGVIADRLRQHGAVVTFVRATGVTAIAELGRLIGAYTSAVLHIHPDDISAVLAARLARQAGTRVGLYNHADHVFTFGHTACDVVLEVSIYGRAISKKYRPAHHWSFAGIPLDAPAAPAKSGADEYILSSGPAYKYDFREGGVFASLLVNLIAATNRKCLIVGPGKLPPDASNELKELARVGLLQMEGEVSRDVYVQYLAGCFCYLDSAPVSGGSAFPEAALAGKECLGLTNPIMGYSPADAMRSTSVDELVRRARNLSGDGLDPLHRLISEVHDPKQVLDRIERALVDGTVYGIPFDVQIGAIDSEFMQKGWARNQRLDLRGRAGESLSLANRAAVLRLLWRTGLMGRVRWLRLLQFCCDSFAFRRIRGDGAADVPKVVLSVMRGKRG